MAVNSATARLAVAAITKFERRAEDAISDAHKEWKWLRASKAGFVTKSHGTAIQWQGVVQRQAVTGFSRNTTTNFVPQNRMISLSLSNAGYSCSGQVHWTDLQECQGEQQLVDLMKAEFEWMPEAMQRAFVQDFWASTGAATGNSANPITGVAGYIVNTGTYAGAAYATDPAFFGSGNNVLAATGVHAAFTTDPIPSLTAAVLASERGADAGESETFADAIWAPYDLWSIIHNSLQAQGRGELAATKYSTGAKELHYMGVPIHRTRFLADGSNVYYVLNSKFLDTRTPAAKILNTFQREEGSPWSKILLMVFYGLHRCILPRAQVRAAVT